MLINGSKIYGAVSSTAIASNSIFVDSSDYNFKYKNASDIVKKFTNKRVNDAFSCITCRNTIRQLQDRVIVFSTAGGEYADAYVDADGRLNSVETGSTDATFDTDKYIATGSVTSYIYQDIPAGTFSATIENATGVALVEDWDSADTIQYKLKNAGEDSGWLDVNERSTFTTFVAEPDKIIIKLDPKPATSTTGYPSINGFGVRE